MDGVFGIFGHANVIVLLDFASPQTKSVMMDVQPVLTSIPGGVAFLALIVHGIRTALEKLIASAQSTSRGSTIFIERLSNAARSILAISIPAHALTTVNSRWKMRETLFLSTICAKITLTLIFLGATTVSITMATMSG